MDKAEREIMQAIRCGVNYFDTAYVYPGNEEALGRILEKNHCREQIAGRDRPLFQGAAYASAHGLYRLLSDSYAQRFAVVGAHEIVWH